MTCIYAAGTLHLLALCVVAPEAQCPCQVAVLPVLECLPQEHLLALLELHPLPPGLEAQVPPVATPLHQRPAYMTGDKPMLVGAGTVCVMQNHAHCLTHLLLPILHFPGATPPTRKMGTIVRAAGLLADN